MNEKKKYMSVPLIKSVENIKNIENGKVQDVEQIYYNNINNLNNTKKFYAYKIKDSTMEPIMYKKDIVIFEKSERFSNNDICIIKIANEEAIARRISRTDGIIFLEPLNREYDTTIYKEEDLNKTIKIIGKVVTMIRDF